MQPTMCTAILGTPSVNPLTRCELQPGTAEKPSVSIVSIPLRGASCNSQARTVESFPPGVNPLTRCELQPNTITYTNNPNKCQSPYEVRVATPKIPGFRGFSAHLSRISANSPTYYSTIHRPFKLFWSFFNFFSSHFSANLLGIL